MTDPLKNLALDTWYKLVLVVGIILLIIGLTQDTRALANKQVIVIAGALISFGLAEWRCDSHVHYYKPPNVYTGPGALITEPLRVTTPASVLLHVLAAGLLLWFVITLWA